MKSHYRVYSEESTAAEHAGSLSAAQIRAEELAAKHPGRSFEILRCVGYASTSKASTFWMDDEGPEHPLESMRPGWKGIDREEPEKPRYRMLDEGEVFEEGDEYTIADKWHKVPPSSYNLKFTRAVWNFDHRRPL